MNLHSQPSSRALCVALAALSAAALAAPAGAQARDRFDTRVLAQPPAPGNVAASVVAPDGTIYAGTFENTTGDSDPSRLFAYDGDGTLKRTYDISGQDLTKAHGVQASALDAQGRIYVLDQNPPRALRIDPATERQATYATFADVPTCTFAAPGTPCSQTTMDNEPEPDYAAFGPDGSLYVTDYLQGLIWKVPPGGGAAKVWFSSPALDGQQFGPAGIRLAPDMRTLMLTSGATGLGADSDPTTGALYRLSIQADGSAGELSKVWDSKTAEAPDGLALSKDGNAYIALVGPNVNQVVEVSPQGKELARFPSAAQNSGMEVPFDSPSSVAFRGQSLIITNLAFFTGERSHMVLFDTFVGEDGQAVFIPPAEVTADRIPGTPVNNSTPSAGPQAGPRPQLHLQVSPRRAVAGRRTKYSFRVTYPDGSPMRSALVRFAGHGRRTASNGRATLRVTVHHPKLRNVAGTHFGTVRDDDKIRIVRPR